MTAPACVDPMTVGDGTTNVRRGALLFNNLLSEFGSLPSCMNRSEFSGETGYNAFVYKGNRELLPGVEMKSYLDSEQ
jgi:hypothetical protein